MQTWSPCPASHSIVPPLLHYTLKAVLQSNVQLSRYSRLFCDPGLCTFCCHWWKLTPSHFLSPLFIHFSRLSLKMTSSWLLLFGSFTSSLYPTLSSVITPQTITSHKAYMSVFLIDAELLKIVGPRPVIFVAHSIGLPLGRWGRRERKIEGRREVGKKEGGSLEITA